MKGFGRDDANGVSHGAMRINRHCCSDYEMISFDRCDACYGVCEWCA